MTNAEQNIHFSTVAELNNIMNYLKENTGDMARIGNTVITYDSTQEVENGKIEFYILQRRFNND